MKHFDYLMQSYKDAYKKSRYWFTVLFVFLLIQIWIQVSMPGSELLTPSKDILWNNRFLTYITNSFKPDSARAESIIIKDLLKSKFKYKYNAVYINPPEEDGAYFKSVNTFSDSLIKFNLMDSVEAKIFLKELFKCVKDSVISFRKEHVRRDDSLKATEKESVKGISSARYSLHDYDTNEFRKILDAKIESLFYNLIEDKIVQNLIIKIENLNTDTVITYQTLIDINEEKYRSPNELLDTNLIKNPYIDLPLKAEVVLIIILFISIIVYWYFSFVIKYYSKLEKMIESYTIPDVLKSSSLKNINFILRFVPLSSSWDKNISYIIYSFIPFIIIGFYTRYLFSIELTLIIMLIVFSFKLFIWVNNDHPAIWSRIIKSSKK